MSSGVEGLGKYPLDQALMIMTAWTEGEQDREMTLLHQTSATMDSREVAEELTYLSAILLAICAKARGITQGEVLRQVALGYARAR
jgi:hypothetical protein